MLSYRLSLLVSSWQRHADLVQYGQLIGVTEAVWGVK